MENFYNLPVITLTHLKHREQNQIKLEFFPDTNLLNIVKNIPGIKWSQTNKCWYLLNNPQNLKALFSSVKGTAYIDGNNFFKNNKFEPNIIINKTLKNETRK